MFQTVRFCIVFFLCWSLKMEAQNVKVESFSRLENDITARVNVVKDANDDECALIKMVTTDTAYNLDEGLKRESRVGEIWFYVPQGTKRIVIRHQKLGKLVYDLPESLKAKTTYQIKLPDNVEIIVHEDVGGQYLVMNVQPTDAVVYIDGIPEVLSNGVLQKMLKYGRHAYRIEAPLYVPAEGEVLIEKERKNVNVNLAPNFGFVRFVSVPESGASIYIDGKLIGKTPITTDKLEKRQHSVKAVLPMHNPISQEVMVEAGRTLNVNLNFSANFATVTLTTSDGEIWVNGERKGEKKWIGRLMPGLYKVETRKPGHRSFVKSVELVAGENRVLELSAPVPMIGILNTSSNEVGVTVKVDNQVVGPAPNVFKVLVGKHRVEFSKDEFNPVVYEVLIEEGKVAELKGILQKKSVDNDYTLKNREKKNYSDLDINFATIPYERIRFIKPNDIKVFINDRKRVAYVYVQSYSEATSKFYRYSFDTGVWKECSLGYLPYCIKEWGMLLCHNGYYDSEQDKWFALDEKQPQIGLSGDNWGYIDETVGLAVSSILWGRGKNAGIVVYNPNEKRIFLLRVNCPEENVSFSLSDGHLFIRTYEKWNKHDEMVGVRWYVCDPKEKEMLQQTAPPVGNVTLKDLYHKAGNWFLHTRELKTGTNRRVYMME